jgi:anti-anti-sigma factor
MAGLGVGSTSDMTFDVLEGEAGSVTVTVRGELDITNVERLASAVAPVLERKPARLVVDVGEVAFADSSAIAVWVQWATSGPETELRNAPALLRRVIESMGLTETLVLTP